MAGLVGDADDAAGGTGASVASLLGLGVATLAEVVGAAVDNDGALVVISILFVCYTTTSPL